MSITVKILRSSLIVLVLLFAAYVVWLHSDHLLFYRQIVLKAPIRLEEGSYLKHQFSVDVSAKYLVGIGYNRTYQFTLEAPVPNDFTAEGKVTLDNKTVTNTFPTWDQPASLGKDYIIRYFYAFDGEPGRTYELSLQIGGVVPIVTNANAEVTIAVDPHFDAGCSKRKELIISLAIGSAVALIFCIAKCNNKTKRNYGTERGPVLRHWRLKEGEEKWSKLTIDNKGSLPPGSGPYAASITPHEP